MLIVGTGGLALDLLGSFEIDFPDEEVIFFNDTDMGIPDYISGNYKILRSFNEAEIFFKTQSAKFIVAIGDNHIREKLTLKFISLGGVNTNHISQKATIYKHCKIAKEGVIILPEVIISNGCNIGTGSVIYCNSSLGHNSKIGNYSLISGNTCMSNCEIGDYVFIGIGTSIKPTSKIANNAYIGSGSNIINNIQEYALAYGNPAREHQRL